MSTVRHAPVRAPFSPVRARTRPLHLGVCFVLFAAPLIAIHLHLLNLPFFWDELGQFIPTALDLLRYGEWIPHSAIPNVHPPGVEVYLVLWYKLFGFSIAITRLAMLTLAAVGLLGTFLLAIDLSRGARGTPAFLPPVFLLLSPLFYMQSMMAQLDMPAMVFTLFALLFFTRGRYRSAAVACLALVLTKETGIIVPAVFALLLLLKRDWRRSLLFVPSAIALALWLLLMHTHTGYWLGNPGFAHYNVEYALSPVRALFSLARRIYYLLFAEFRWIGTLVLLVSFRQCRVFRTYAWLVVSAVCLATLLVVSIFGGAELERYLLPVLPIFYIAVSIGIATLRSLPKALAITGLAVGLVCNIFWNPPYPFPYENNYSMVDFVRLQQAAAAYLQLNFADRRIATAWPFSAALRRSEYGFVSRRLKTVETGDFHASSIDPLPPGSFDVLVTYTRTWMPEDGVAAFAPAQRFLSRFYEWEPDVTPSDCSVLGLEPAATWVSRGQQITIYVRKNPDL